jgi:ankyrin repeat protein
VNFADNKGNTALFYAVKRKYDSEQIEMLLKYGADANKKSKDGISPKMLAASNRKNILRLFT